MASLFENSLVNHSVVKSFRHVFSPSFDRFFDPVLVNLTNNFDEILKLFKTDYFFS